MMENKVKLVVPGSIRDINPMPQVTTNNWESQSNATSALEDVDVAIFVGSTLKSVGTGNLMPNDISLAAVDTNRPCWSSSQTGERGRQQA